jgi:cytochrome c553
VNEKFDLSMCINCHGDAGHGPLTTYPEYCSRCHNTRDKPGFFSTTHSLSSAKTQPLRFLMENMSLSLNLLLIVGVLFIFLIYVIRFHKVQK